jgi:hypothetical protein
VGDYGDQSEELMRDGEEGHFRGGTSLSLSFSYFVFSSIGAANIHRITWTNIKRAGDDGHQSEGLMRDGEEGHLSFSLFFLLRLLFYRRN